MKPRLRMKIRMLRVYLREREWPCAVPTAFVSVVLIIAALVVR